MTGTSTTFVPVPTFFGFLPIPYQSLNFAFTQPDANSFGNLGRNSVRGPGYANYNVSLFRSFVIYEQAIRVPGEATIPNQLTSRQSDCQRSDANFGQATSTLPYRRRRLQVAVRILF